MLHSGFGPVVAGRRVLIYLNDRSRGMFAFIGWGIGEKKKKYSFGEGETWEKHAMISYQLHPLKTWSERLRDLQIKGAAAVKTHLFHFNSFPIYNTRLVRTCMFWVRCRISVTYSGKEKSRTYWKRSKHAELQYIHCARIVHENRREITELKKNMWPS